MSAASSPQPVARILEAADDVLPESLRIDGYALCCDVCGAVEMALYWIPKTKAILCREHRNA